MQIIHNFNYLVSNTSFSSQYLLAEDMKIGHIVDVCPSLSPYLFIQIILHIKCEDLLIESLVHYPLDLCVEILEITIRCINDMESLQNRRFVFFLISKLYYKCMWLHQGTLSKHDIAELSCQLVAHFQALLELINTKFVASNLSKQEKYVQHGILLKYLLRCIKTCMLYKRKNHQIIYDMLHPFKITYGNPFNGTDYFCKLPYDKTQSIVETLDQELITLLQDHIKQVDCFEFMEWAEVDDEENVLISLQRAFIIECHCFMEFMKQDEYLLTNEDLLQYLRQLVGSSNSEESILTLEELCNSIINGKLDKETGVRDLIRRYKQWDESTLNFISKNTTLFSKIELGVIFEYLHYIFMNVNNYEEKHRAYLLVLDILIQEELSTMYFLVLHYTIRHFHDNRLVCLFKSELFRKFIESNHINMSNEEKLRVILIFIMLNPKEVLTTVVRVAIGSTDIKYRNIILSRFELIYLHAFFTSKLNDQNDILSYLLKDAWLHDHSTWNYKQFEYFMSDTLANEVITLDNLLNNVYIPWLTSDVFNYSNLLSVLIHMYSVLRKMCKAKTRYKTNYVFLIVQLIKKMSTIRRCNPRCLRNIVNDLLDRATMILNLLFATNVTDLNDHDKIIKINNIVEPIDQVLLMPRSQTMLRGTVHDVIQNYERRCLTVYQKYRADSHNKSELHDYVHSFKLDKRALLRHMMLHATEEEYKNFAIEITMASWAYFGWKNEMTAYKNVLHITTEAMKLALMFTNTFPKDTFVSLLRSLVQFCQLLLCLKRGRRDLLTNSNIIHILLETLSSLKDIVSETQHGKAYCNMLESINDLDNPDPEIEYYCLLISDLIEVHFVESEEIEDEASNKLKNGSLSHSISNREIIDMLKAYEFVCKCINTIFF
ncbi:hypothetical protein PUN28_006288 [Cardiocondyla obscurior]